ncbi:hypothetical protein IO424_000737 [Campylobacter fetus]|nr:hypothetical protein [Campylobacter fetus]EGK8072913.1 hypothetical protein [Campylobacter fetus]EGK8171680.1 hypothetical protein [Campylobacter fetus]EKR8079631.1 hypothetical protein [Campylobacter fetus]WKW17370.1 hypothetical protein IXZ25_09485 [Campylobacter fetus subsp. fetus]HDX6331933.1 hypothetical protein [Campylobacter fetus]
MSIRLVGEYALVKPGREMLFVPLNSESKYKVKNFLDSVKNMKKRIINLKIRS